MGPQTGMGNSGPADNAGRPGGGIGAPINSPDPLTKYKWWILGGLTLLLIAAAAWFLRKGNAEPSAGAHAANEVALEPRPLPATARTQAAHSTAPPASSGAVLLNVLKEELFAIESEKLSGTLSATEYAQVKTGLEALLKRTLNRK